MMKADVIRAHEVEQGMFERNYTSFTLRCKRHRGFSLHASCLPASRMEDCHLQHGNRFAAMWQPPLVCFSKSGRLSSIVSDRVEQCAGRGARDGASLHRFRRAARERLREELFAAGADADRAARILP